MTMPIWERQPDESLRWYHLFCSYRDFGPTRSIMKAIHKAEEMSNKVKRSTSVPGSWWKAYQQYNWRRRAEAFDAYLQNERASEIQRVMTEDLDSIAKKAGAVIRNVMMEDLDSIAHERVERFIAATDDTIRDEQAENERLREPWGTFRPQTQKALQAVADRSGQAMAAQVAAAIVSEYVPRPAQVPMIELAPPPTAKQRESVESPWVRQVKKTALML